MDAPPTHDSIGKYRVIAKLGQGGMAKVLLTVASGKAGFEKLLVVKELREELAHEPEFLTMFLDEARLAARLNHPNVVHTYEVGQDGDRHFIAMDYLDGQPLVALLRKVGRGKVPLDLHVRVLADMLSGLDYAHRLTDFDGTALRVVHRDVSPHNVFITYDGQVKVVDFGIAKAVGASTQTKTGVYKGKAGYIAPEQAKASTIDARADIFAVGVMLWEALAGQRMATAESDIAVLALRIGGMDRKVREVAPDAPADLAAACDRAMALDPNERFESASAMRDVLEAWLEGQPRRAGAKDLGAYVAEVFAKERAELRVRIDEHLKRVRESAHGPIPVLDIAPAGMRADATPTPRREDETVHASNLSASATGRASASPARGRLGLVVFVAVAAAIALAVFTWRGDRRGDDAPAVADAGTVEVRLHRTPADAVATLDGAVLSGNPFRGRFPKDRSSHTLEIRAPGYLADKRILAFDRDVDLTISLSPEPSPSAAASVVDSPTVPSAARSAAPPSAEPPPRRPASPATTRGSPAPTSAHDIDEKNPYGR